MLFVMTAASLLAYIGGVSLLMYVTNMQDEVVRKLVHIGTGSILFAGSFYLTPTELLFFIALILVSAYVSRFVPIVSKLHTIDRLSHGEMFLPVGIGIATVLVLPISLPAFQFGILVATFSDTVAALVGRNYGKHSFFFFGAQKSIEGSLAFFFVTTAIGTAMFGVSGTLIAVSLALMIVEIVANYGLDNVTLPVIAAYLAFFVLV